MRPPVIDVYKRQVIGCGAISSFWGSKTESILLTIFVSPDYHGQGIGRRIIEALEQDELYLRAKIIRVPSSITACKFYEKMGFQYENGEKIPDLNQLYQMEKIREI